MSKTKIPEVSVFRFLLHSTQILKNPLPFHATNFKNHGDTFRLNLGFGNSVIFSRDAGFAQYALQKNQKNYTKSEIQTKDLAKYVGKGLLTSEGELWKKQRKLIQPAFHKKQMVKLVETINSAIKTELEKIIPNKAFNVFPIFNDLAFQTVVKSLFSSEVSEKEINRLQRITEDAQKMLVQELRQPFLIWWFNISGKIEHHIDETNEARAILLRIVNERRQSGKRYEDLLDMLLDARYEDGNAMDDAQLLDEILILFTAGHETTSNALTFTCELLARNLSVQEKIFAEVKNAKEKTENLSEFIRQCTYTKQVVEESLRLYPPAYFIDRTNIEEDEFNGMIIPKNTSLLFSLHEIHRHSDFWENPDDFNPDRFGGDSQLQYSEYYYPFGAGPRMCIGSNFAMYEMILAIAEVMFKYKIEEKKTPIQFNPLITLKPKNAVLRFLER